MKYLIEMAPIDSYAFSGESSFLNPGEARTRRSSYHVGSEYLPPQTTVLGTLRRCLLEWNNLFRNDKQYSNKETGEMDSLIGKEPFRLGSSKFELGKLKGISCLFLTQFTKDKQERWLFPVPRNAKQGDDAKKYEAMPWERQKMLCDEVSLEDFNVKKPLASGYVAVPFSRHDTLPFSGVEAVFEDGLKDGFLIPKSDIFVSYQQSAVRKVENDDQKGYRIHERVMFNQKHGKFAFAVLAELDEGAMPATPLDEDGMPLPPPPLIVSMGARGSLFRVQATPLRQETKESVRALPQRECCIAVLSPLELPDDWRQKVSFAILSKQKIRQMVQISSAPYVYQHDSRLRYFAAPGSVLYCAAEDAQELLKEIRQNESLYKAGFNHVIIMDGEELA